MSARRSVSPAPPAVRARPRRLHHAASVTRDRAPTRRVHEDVIAVPLVATRAEKAPGPGRENCRTVHEMGDGSALAFFQIRRGH